MGKKEAKTIKLNDQKKMLDIYKRELKKLFKREAYAKEIIPCDYNDDRRGPRGDKNSARTASLKAELKGMETVMGLTKEQKATIRNDIKREMKEHLEFAKRMGKSTVKHSPGCMIQP